MEFEESKKPDLSESPSFDIYDGLFNSSSAYHPQFKDFDIIKQIGEGAFGRVFKVKHRDSGLVMAMKTMKK